MQTAQQCWSTTPKIAGYLHVAFVCNPRCMLLSAAGSCCAKFETGQTFEPTTVNISFAP